MTSSSTNLRSAVESTVGRTAPDLSGLREVWLFGSALHSADAGDVDLLVVYDGDVIAAADAVSHRASLDRAMQDVLGLHAHVVLLNPGEAKETRFAEREGAELVWQFDADKG